MPVAQKYIAGSGWPSARVTAETMAPNGPCVPALSIAITGMMVRKMPAKSLATSTIGPHSNWLSACTASRGDRLSDSSDEHDQPGVAHQARQADLGAEDVEPHRRLPEAAEQHQRHHARRATRS